jgi:MFS transporter, ACS family, allantoate permease
MYFLTGGLAILVGIAVIFWMPDSPVHAEFLTRDERVIAVERIRDDQGGTENKRIKKSQIIEAVSDIRTWLVVVLTIIGMCKGLKY